VTVHDERLDRKRFEENEAAAMACGKLENLHFKPYLTIWMLGTYLWQWVLTDFSPHTSICISCAVSIYLYPLTATNTNFNHRDEQKR
jgi:hypothetical protein